MYTFLEIVEMLKQRYQIENLTLVPFDPDLQCYPDRCDDYVLSPRIFLLDADGTPVAFVIEWDTVRQTLDELDNEERKEVAYILYIEREEIAVAPIHI